MNRQVSCIRTLIGLKKQTQAFSLDRFATNEKACYIILKNTIRQKRETVMEG